MNLTRLRRRAAIAAMLLALSGCATISDPLPVGYAGPIAHLQDFVVQETSGKGRVFAAVEIDGNPIHSAFIATRRASAGRGFGLSMAGASRDVPVKPLQVKLLASHVTAAPIHEIALRAAGDFHEVSGVIPWTPKADVTYEVRGTLSSSGSTVWIEEAATHVRVTEVVRSSGSSK